MPRRVSSALRFFLLLMFIAMTVAAAETPVSRERAPQSVGTPNEQHLTKASGKKFDLRSLPFVPQPKRERPEREAPPLNPIPLGSPNSVNVESKVTPDLALQVNAPAPPPLASFDGLDFANWGAGHPPDTNGDVGPQYYIQTINTSIGVFRKSDGVRVAAFTFNTFMSQGSFGNLCDTDNFGDPVVLYDSFEDRWVITDFAFQLDGSGNVVHPPGSFQCFAVSMNGDPVTGGWNYYSINTAGGLGDYPKFGIWPDGLYMSANMFDYAAAGAFQNSRLYAFNKTQMYAGSPTVNVVSFDLPSSQFTVLPANARLQTGTPPPGSPNYFASVWNFLNAIEIWKFHVDFLHPSLSTVTGPFDSNMTFWWEQYSRSGATTAPTPANALDTLYPRLMVQNQYTNLGGTESLWDSHTVGAGNPTSSLTSAQSAVRYYQVNVTGGTVAATTPQSFTFSPDATRFRYLPSVAVNRSGDMAIGYTTSNATTNPAIVYAGRLAGDAANTITQTEQLLFQGTGSQSGTCGGTCTRWGDYSAMTLDPNGCTFWYTNEYYVANGLNFNTRIGSFAFPSCTPVGAGGTVSGTVIASAGGTPIAGATVSLGARSTTTDANGNYAFSAIPAGTYASITASYSGFVSQSHSGIAVSDGGTTTENFSLGSASSGSCTVDTTQSDFQAGVLTNVDITTTPGNVVLSKPDLLDQQNSTVSPTGFGITNSSWAGQTFTAAISGKLVRADVELFCAACTANSPNITFSIRATTGATPVPTGADLATATLTGFNDGGAGGLKTVTFSTPFTVTAGTRYAVIFRNAGAFPSGTVAYTCSCVTTGFSDSNPYASGQRVTSSNNGASWTADTTTGGRDLNFRVYINAGYSTTGTFVSGVKDGDPGVGNLPNWSTLSWTAVTPANTSLKFQVAGSNNVNGPFSFVGPDGTAATFFTTSGASIAQFNGLRYLEYEALLGTTDTTATPTVNDVTACFADRPCPATGPAITPSHNPFCPLASGMTASVPAGAANYSWAITNGTIVGSTTSNSVTFNVGSAGSVGLQVTLTDATGCVKVSTLSVPIDVVPTPTITPGGPTAICPGGSVTLTSSAPGGNQWYLNGAPIGSATSQTYLATAAGSYTVNVVDANGCVSPMSASTAVTVNPHPLATITISNAQTVTVTGSGNFTLTFNGATTGVFATGATAAAVQAALNALQTIGGAGGSVAVSFSGGVYTVTFGGTLTGPQPEMTSSASAGVTALVRAAPVCPSSANNQAAAPPNLSYQWNITNGTITNGPNFQVINYTTNSSGDVILDLTVTDGNGCSASTTADIPLASPPTTPTISADTNATGTQDQACPEQPLTLHANGATGATSYQWYSNNDTLNGETASTYQAVGAATYYVVAIGSGGCSTPQSAGYVVQNPTPHSPFISFRNQDSSVTTLAICQGSSQIIDSDSATGIQWYKDGIAIPVGGNNQSYTATQAGVYTAQLDALGCHSQFGRNVTLTIEAMPPTPTISGDTNGTGTQDQACPEEPLTLHANGATGAQSYTWYSDNAVIPNENTATLVMTGVGNISVTATNGSCTTAHSATYVVQNPTPHSPFITIRNQPSTTTSIAICQGTSIILDSDSATGIAWWKDGVSMGFGSQSLTVSTAGVYTAQLDALGCHSQFGRNITVTVNPLPPTPTITPGGPTTFCQGSSVVLTSSSAAGYQWKLNGSPIGGATLQTYSATTTGSYTVTISDANGCTAASAATSVTVNPTPAAPTITPGGPTTFCAGGSVTLTSSSASGNQWLLNGAPINTATSQTYVANTSGDYTVIGTSNGCPSAPSAATTVTVNPIPSSTITAPSSVVTGSTGNTASVTNAGAGATYNWSITNGTITAGTGTNSIAFTAGAVGTLTLQVTVTANGCSSTSSANVNVGVPPVTVTAVSPSHGSINGGLPVAISGTGFKSGATVKFGGTAATNVVFVSATSITAKSPAHAAGAVNVVVTNTDTSSGTLTNGFTYVPQRFDANGDGVVDPSDIFYLVNYLFMNGPAPMGAAGLMSGDANGDGVVDPSDIFFTVNYLFDGGSAPQSVRLVSDASSAPLAGSIALGAPFGRDGKSILPVIVSMKEGSPLPASLSLRIVFTRDVAVGAVRRTVDLQPRFEISRVEPRSIAYLVSYPSGVRSGVIAEIEFDGQPVDAAIDPALTLLGDTAGGAAATPANGRLVVVGTKIPGERPPHDGIQSVKDSQ